jgi:hypothetical protein
MKDSMKFLVKILILLSIFNSCALALISASIVDENTSSPIVGAIISDSKISVVTDENGSFYIDSNESLFNIKAHGYNRFSFTSDANNSIMKIKAINIKALYLSFWGASMNSSRNKRVIEIIEKTELNAIVMDVKNEYGSTSYKTSVKEANFYGAHEQRTNRCISKFIELMKSKGIYTIARVVTFKDELQASNNPDYAIKKQDGTIWRNHDDMAWVDPFDKRSHDYTLAIAEDAAKVGFDEINFDYIRFPAKKDLVLSKESTEENRVQAIENFLINAQETLRPYGTFISVDTYGNVCWETGDIGIGQKVESLAKYADYLAPMLYPSGFAKGSFNFENPSEHPYAVIYRSIKNIDTIIDPVRVRPWLQYFKDYAHTKKQYKKLEVNEQIRATCDINTSGWMMWSPSSRYHLDYFNPAD